MGKKHTWKRTTAAVMMLGLMTSAAGCSQSAAGRDGKAGDRGRKSRKYRKGFGDRNNAGYFRAGGGI